MKSSRCTGSSSKPQQHRAQRCFSFQVLSAQEMFSKRGLCVWREFLQLHPDPAVCRVPPCKQKIQPEIILLNIFFLYHSGVKREGIKTRTALKTPVRHAEYHKLRLSDCIYLTEQEDDFFFFFYHFLCLTEGVDWLHNILCEAAGTERVCHMFCASTSVKKTRTVRQWTNSAECKEGGETELLIICTATSNSHLHIQYVGVDGVKETSWYQNANQHS